VSEPTQEEHHEGDGGADDFARLGGEVANVLRTAQSAADGLRQHAVLEAEGILGEARRDAERLTGEATEEAERLTGQATEDAARTRAEADQEAAALRSEAEDDRRTAAEAREQAQAEADRIVHEAQQRAERVLGSLREREGDARAHVDRAVEQLQTISSELTLFAGGPAVLDLEAEEGAAEPETETEGDRATSGADQATGEAPEEPAAADKEPVPPVRDPSEARQSSGDPVDGAVKAGVAKAVTEFFAGKREGSGGETPEGEQGEV
jgi:cell division septum initiation protein DivIVA